MLITEIETKVKSYCNRTDTEFSNEIRGWVNRFIRENVCSHYNFWFMKYSGTIPTVDGTRSYDLPSSYKDDEDNGIAYRDSNNNITVLDIVSKEQALKEFSPDDEGEPALIVLGGDDDEYDVYPKPDDAYNIDWDCYTYLADLDDTNTSNYLTVNYPRMLIYAAVAEGWRFLGEHNEANVWEAKAEAELQDIMAEDVRRKTGKISLAPRADVKARANAKRSWEK